jgi:ABC-type oligopeptide transport system substrate-binding subunit
MKNRFRISVVMATIGTCLLVASAFAGGAASAPNSASKAGAKGGTLRLDSRSDFDFIDPSLAYFSHSWQMMRATQLNLLGFADKEAPAGTRLLPRAAAAMPTVSKDGKTYTFKIKAGFKFSNGEAVDASSYARSFTRALNPKMQSPAAAFLTDLQRVKANGNTPTVTLKKVAPDFLARTTMPFFAALPKSIPNDPDGVQAPAVSAGPYYVKEWVQKRSALLARNPYWNNAKEPWKSLARPANVDAISYTFGTSLDAQKLRLDKGEVDLGTAPPSAYADIAKEYGINKPNGRFFLRKQNTVWYFNLNTQGPLFKGNAKLRQAVNWAIDRPQITRQHGYLGGTRTDQILPAGMPGFKDWNIYPIQGVNSGSLAKAKSLANGATRNGKAVLYEFNTAPGPQIAQVIQFNLKQIGLDVDVKLFDRVVQTDKGGSKSEINNFDILHNGWGQDYPDPFDFINVLMDGGTISESNNVNLSYFDDPAWNAKMRAAAALSGDSRLTAYANLDRDITKNAAPWASYIMANARIYVSSSVGCYAYDPILSSTNLVAVCKK